MADSDPVLFERVDEHIALVTLNRPEKRHAVNGAVARRLGAIVQEIERDEAVRAVVLTSSGGPTFCAGADLAEVAAGRGAELSTPEGGFGGFVEAQRVKPWIVAVRGSALGGGLEFSLACDLRVIGETTVLGLPEVKRGLIAGAGGVYRLPRQIPRAVALEMIALGEGRTRQQEIAVLARAAGVNLLGPNCLGFLNLLDRVSIWTSTFATIAPGNVAIVSQSGAVASYIVDYAVQQGVGLGYVISTGNEADLSLARVVDFLVDDPRVQVVAAFMETARDAAVLAAAAARARAAGKAIVALKIGAGALTAAAAQAHTGSIVGDDSVFTAACRRHNIVRVGSIEEMVATAELIARFGPPAAPQLGVLSMSGGICEISADRAEAVGAPVGPFSAATSAALGGLMPDYGTASNPLDVTGAAVSDPSLFGRAVATIADDREIGLVAVVFDMPDQPEGITFRMLREIGASTKPGAAPTLILSTSIRPVGEDIRATAEACGLRFLGHGIEHGMAALAHVFRWSAALGEPAPVAADTAATSSQRPSGERATLDMLAGYGVPVVRGVVVTTEDEAAAAAGEGRCAFKIASPDIPHKSDIGGVILNVAGAAAARKAFRTILDRARERAPRAAVDGVLVSPMRDGGLELFAGILRDPDWGLAIAVGLGGVWVELVDDTSLRLLPITHQDALAMLSELRATRLLDGYRGGEAADRGAVAAAVVALGEAALAQGPALVALEVNPLWVRGDHVEALDALATWRED